MAKGSGKGSGAANRSFCRITASIADVEWDIAALAMLDPHAARISEPLVLESKTSFLTGVRGPRTVIPGMTYAPVNGLQLYYEIRGSGRPLVLLHGGLLTIDLSFGPICSASASAVWSRTRSRSARPPGSAS